MNETIQSLRKTAWSTACARYNAARRLRRRELFSTISLAFFSALSIAIPVFQKIYVKSGSSTDNYVTFLSISLGIAILTLTLIEWGSANGSKAEILHKNAEDLNSFQRKLEILLAEIQASPLSNWKLVHDLQLEYESIKAKISVNHETIDYEFFLAQHRFSKEFQKNDGTPKMNQDDADAIKISWNLSSIKFFLSLWLIVIAGLIGIISTYQEEAVEKPTPQNILPS